MANTKRKPGDFFLEIVGKPIGEMTIPQIDAAVASRLGKRQLSVAYCTSTAISRRGVFPYRAKAK